MRARLFINEVDTGSVARDFIYLVRRRKSGPVNTVVEDETPTGAAEVLDTFWSHQRERGPENILTGRNVIVAMDEQLQDVGYIPDGLSKASKQFADWVTRGSLVSLPGDDRRFYVVKILWERESIRLRDDEGRDYVVPWKIIKPWDEEETSR